MEGTPEMAPMSCQPGETTPHNDMRKLHATDSYEMLLLMDSVLPNLVVTFAGILINQ